jgi:hypothetical protein
MSDELDDDTLRGFLDDRRQSLAARVALLRHERERAWPGGRRSPTT